MTLNGKNINLRVIRMDGAGFIVDLRKDIQKTKYLSQVKGTVKDQEQWISQYKIREKRLEEYYFIIESKAQKRLGLVRMYDFQDHSFCWGSWLIKDNAPKTTAIESALQIYEFAFYTLNFTQSHFDVRKGNGQVAAFHKRFGAKIIDETDIDYYFIFQQKDYEETRKKYQRYL